MFGEVIHHYESHSDLLPQQDLHPQFIHANQWNQPYPDHLTSISPLETSIRHQTASNSEGPLHNKYLEQHHSRHQTVIRNHRQEHLVSDNIDPPQNPTKHGVIYSKMKHSEHGREKKPAQDLSTRETHEKGRMQAMSLLDQLHASGSKSPSSSFENENKSLLVGKDGEEKSFVWYGYRDPIKGKIVKILHLYTGLKKASIFQICRKRFQDHMRYDILSGEEDRIIRARNALFPPTAWTYKAQTWMQNMSMSQSEEVVRKISKATGGKVSKEVTRNHFLNRPLTEEKAWEIYHTSEMDCGKFIGELELMNENVRKSKKQQAYRTASLSPPANKWRPWMTNIEELQQKKVVALVMEASGLDPSQCYDILKYSSDASLGLQILHSTTMEEVQWIVQSLMSAMAML
jgi:hypothetical protein